MTVYTRPKPSADGTPATGTDLVVTPLEAFEQGRFKEGAEASPTETETPRASGWFHYRNLKIEAAIFLLIALTFAAVLGESALTKQQLLLTPRTGPFVPYSFSDTTNDGHSTISAPPSQPLSWSCELREGFAYPYCGYGLRFAANDGDKGLDFSHYRDITLRLTYHGVGNHMKLSVKTRLPESLRAKLKDDTMPVSTEFDVVQGENEIHLSRDQLTTEQWWVGSHHLASSETRPQWGSVEAVSLNTGGGTPLGHVDIAVQSLTFNGAYLTTEQFYLVILGVWLVLTGAFLVFRFLTLRKGYEARQRQQAEESRILATARAAAEDASAAKSQFLANMSHELRTPLNAILGYAQLLQTGDLSQKQASAVNTIQHSGEHLLTMITDILDIAKVEAGRLELLPGPFDIRTCVATVAQMIRLRADEKGLLFTVEVADDVPRGVVGDQKRVRQVLINLLVNAVKFTAEGEIRLEVSVIATSRDKAHLRFEVVDTGIGIAADQRQRIFRPFEQAGNAIDRSGGTGLGLAITHQIVGMMNGDIGVESTPGEGSRFYVDVPFALAEAPEVAAEAAPAEMAPAAPEEEALPMQAPDGEPMLRLLALARAGNMRAIRNEVPEILAMGPQYRAFAERLNGLAAAYQSPAVLRLVEQHAQERAGA
ncbi:MAG TPA: ATP-binding protein [Asticcacaulis sp.]|nr:ATP-binding protein [Asticcacaulis sp.]